MGQTEELTMDTRKMADDIIIMAGYWEPDAFIIRGGRSYVGLEEDDFPYSEAMAEKLARLGVNLAVWPYYKGLGIQNEEAQMKRTTEFIRLLHRHGLYAGAYVNIASVFTDTFFHENPEMAADLAIDQYGNPHYYSEFYRCYYRSRICTSSERFARYIAKAAVKAANEGGADLVMFDNSAQMPCYCETCKKAFIDYLLEKFPLEEGLTFRRRFGHEFYGTFQMPKGTPRMPIDTLTAAHEPGLYEWIKFRQGQAEKLHKTCFDAVRENDEATALSWNIALDEGEFVPLLWGLDVESAGRLGSDLFYSEDSNHAGMEGGQLISHLRSFKYARALGNRLFIHNTPGGNHLCKRLNYLQAAAFNGGCVGRVMWATEPEQAYEEVTVCAKFLRGHKDLFLRTRPLADLAIYRPQETEVMNFSAAALSRLAVEQTLIKNSVQFDYVVNDTLHTLGQYKTLMLVNAISVSDAAVEKIAEFVRGGGRLICTEGAMQNDQLGRKRTAVADMGLLGERDNDLGARVGNLGAHTILGYLKLGPEYLGQITHIEHIEKQKELAWEIVSGKPVVIGKEYYLEPLNAQQVLQAIGPLRLRVDGPDNVIAGLFETAQGEAVVHLFDQEHRQGTQQVRLWLRTDAPPATARLITTEGEQDIPLRAEGGGVACELALPVYAAVVLKAW